MLVDQVLEAAREARRLGVDIARRPAGEGLLSGDARAELVLACLQTHGYGTELDPAYVRRAADDLAEAALRTRPAFTDGQLETLLDELWERPLDDRLVEPTLRALEPPVPPDLAEHLLRWAGTHADLVTALLAPR